MDISLQNNNYKSTIQDATGRSGFVGVFGEQLSTDIKNDIIAQFSYGISDYEMSAPVVVGDGTVGLEDNLIKVASITGSAYIETYGKIRYRPGHTILAHFTTSFNNIESNGEGFMGIINGSDGFAIGFKDGVFTIKRKKAGDIYYETEINGDVDLADIDFTKLNIFRISFGYLGIAPVVIEILPEGDTAFKVLHTIKLQGLIDATHINLPYLPVRIESAGGVIVKSASIQGGVMGLCSDCGVRPFARQIEAIGIAANKTTIATFKPRETINGVSNKIRARLLNVNYLVADASGIVKLELIRNPTLSGTPTYSNVDTKNSSLMVSTQQFTVTGGQVGLALYSQVTTGQGNNPPSYSADKLSSERLGLFLEGDNTFAICGQRLTGTGTALFYVNVNWEELF